ncbi:isoprenylcysteine carboxylmethyltransferase family protein [uncultured Thiothrix sp.]|uniref:methyltransferase family protein n=1 Tax=uncultured Thiothrix sp. TaxID=223185 RepID=UPI00262C19ED|nr:isoprenylcysteine carboxylmethyltransferase family protein [uncultured Thiothrix sp.]
MLQTRIPPPVYALLAAVTMGLLDSYWPIVNIFTAPWHRLGLGLIILALLADVWSLWLFFQARTTPNPLKPQNTSQLVTTGLYRYTRNPMYVGMLVMLLGWAIYLGSLSPWLLLPVFIWVINEQQILPEEVLLGQKFGASYQAYKQSVPRWLWR